MGHLTGKHGHIQIFGPVWMELRRLGYINAQSINVMCPLGEYKLESLLGYPMPGCNISTFGEDRLIPFTLYGDDLELTAGYAMFAISECRV